MATHRCVKCDRHFDSLPALEQHSIDTHQNTHVVLKKRPTKLYVFSVIIIIAGLSYFIYPKPVFQQVNLVEHVRGSPNASIEIIEYSDFQCPACGAAYPQMKSALDIYGNKIKFSYRHFPITSIHSFAFKASEASECASEQGKFWEYHDKLFENQKSLSVSDLKKYAAALGLDTNAFNTCLDSGKMATRVKADASVGESLGVDATPTFFVNGQKVVGSITPERLKYIVSSAGITL